MMERILIKGGMAYIKGRLQNADILIGNGIILDISPDIAAPEAIVFSAGGMIVSPGFVDVHVHLREPGLSHKETILTGTQAAAAGGFTTVCTMPNVNPVPDCVEAMQMQLDIIRRDALVEVIPYGSITKGEKGLELSDIERLAPLCAGFSDDGKGVQSREMMLAAMKRIAAVNGLMAAHCEDESLIPAGGCVHDGICSKRFFLPGIPSKSEWLPIQRDMELVRETGARYHVCHVSTRESVELIRKAKMQGLQVTCECTPHQIILCEEDILEDDGRYKMNPPLRTRGDREALLEGLADGTIDCIATDHAPHTPQEKGLGLKGSSFGVAGLETAFAVCYTALVKTGRMTAEKLLDKLTSAPARILKREQTLKAGARADITILNVNESWLVEPDKFLSLGRATPFAGMELKGRVEATFFHGRQVFSKNPFQFGDSWR
jgi:dihydroorotase